LEDIEKNMQLHNLEVSYFNSGNCNSNCSRKSRALRC